jgi:hypothetical protein
MAGYSDRESSISAIFVRGVWSQDLGTLYASSGPIKAAVELIQRSVVMRVQKSD